MCAEPLQKDTLTMGRWVVASTLGWLLGFVLIVIAAVAVDMMGIGETQIMIGIAMGAGVGFMQARLLQQRLGAMAPWVKASIIGMAVPFLVSEVVAALMSGFAYSLVLCVTAGSFMVAVMQRRLLVPHSPQANLWIPACVAGWTLPTVASSGAISGALGSALTLTMIPLGGVVLGLVTGWALGRILPRQTD